MNLETAALIGHLTMFSAILPLVAGLIFFKSLPNFYKIVLASIATSLAFDAFSALNQQFSWSLFWIVGFYDVVAIALWGSAFRNLLTENKRNPRILEIILCILLVASIYFGITRAGVLSSNYQNATLGSLFILAGSTLLVMFFLIVKSEIKRPDIPIIAILASNILYYATVTSIFIFFGSLPEDQVINLYLIKWVLYFVLNLVFAYILYYVGRGKWA